MPPADGNRERLRPSLEGRKFSRYEILEPIGAGGMGEVYKARDLQLGRFVAVKTLRSSDEDSPEHARRLAREARFAASLDHPFICKVHDLVELETGETLLVMEYVEGRTLRAALEDGPLSQARAIRLATEVAEALEFAHAAGLMHRDMKPSNVMVTPNGHVKVMDFGIAKPDGPSEDSTTTTLTGSGRVVGTPAYMSPEQAKGRGVDKRTDIYSFGVMFYECLTGARPSTDGTTRWPDSTSVAPEVRQLVDQCLAPQPDARPESFSEIRARLEQAGAALASSTGLAPAGRRRRSLVGVAAIVLAVIAIVLLVVFKDQWMRTETATTVAVQKPVVTWPSAENGGRISPDGSTVAFVSDRDGHRLWVRSVSGTEPKPITPAREDLRTPVWSPDGRQIAYLFKNSGGAWLEIISVWGESAGPARAIDASWDNVLLVKWIGSHLYLLRPQGNADALWRIDQTDNSLARVTRPGASLLVTRESDVANLDISLDETTLVFASPNPPGDDLVTAALDEGTPAPLFKNSNGIRAV
ncbi:MAG: serine/threonine-protein kinase, partial [Acidobacteria bacterium]